MPDIEANLASWDQGYHWSDHGDEWSATWGGPDAQWWGTIYPRIYPFLPTGTILEIAPGHGRWTRFLAGLGRRLIAVDLSPRCIERCKERFAGQDHLEFHVNDGLSLPMIEDGSIDFCFSFDSLVHCDADILDAYLRALAEKLAPDGVAFLHHSNLADVLARWRWLAKIRPRRFSGPICWEIQRRVNPHWRAPDVSAGRFRELCESKGLRCISQEVINWGGAHLNDCLSTVTRSGSRWDRPTAVVINDQFMAEAARLARLACRPGEGQGAALA